MGDDVTELLRSPYLSATTPLIRSAIQCSLGLCQGDQHLQRFSRSFLARLTEQGALIPNGPNPVKLLGMTLSHHVRNPDHPLAWFNLAIALRLIASSSPDNRSEHNRNRLILAVDACMNAISRTPTAIRSWTELGIIRYLLGQPAESLAAFDKALEIEPMDVPLWLWKAFTLEALGRHNEAVKATRTAQEYYADHGGPEDIADLFEIGNTPDLLENAVAIMQRAIGCSEIDVME